MIDHDTMSLCRAVRRKGSITVASVPHNTFSWKPHAGSVVEVLSQVLGERWT